MADNTLDKYRVLAQLGRGGMADVYLAATLGLGGFNKLLVVKVLQPALARDAQFLSMFMDEARLAARLNHPNVVQTYEVGQEGGRHFIAMEYLEGQPLHRVVERFALSGGLTPAMALRVVIDALSGLHYAHELRDFDGRPLGVVHRDITPQNIFLTYAGQVKVVDFGIAKALDSSTETTVGTVKGKVAYMAPEQARGEWVDRRADLFSMGVVLWELLAGRRLWEGLTDIAVIGRLVQGELPELGKLRPDLPASLCRSCMRALSPSPKDRPQTALDFQKELEAALDAFSTRLNARRIGELTSQAFEGERAQVRTVVQKQLERLARQSASDVTAPDSWRPPQGPVGDMPILGEGSSVHDAVTALHTGLTGAAMTAAGALGAGGGGSVTSAALGSGTMTHVIAAPDSGWRKRWVLAAVGAAGIALGVAQPWRYLKFEVPSDAAAPGAAAPALAPAQGTTREGGARGEGRCAAKGKPLVELTGEIDGDSTLTCDKEYLLRFTAFVSPGATLTIEPGTVVRGDLNTKGTLVIQPGARLHAAGTPERPIVLTSAAPPGQRKPGDWGGLILLGEAPVNLRDASGRPLTGRVEGITVGGSYGGSNPDDSSGVLRFVRIEYSGTELAPNNEINGLTLAGVGRGTVIDHVQVRYTADDCFEFFGGTVDAKYLACQHPGDDAFDWDYGYHGRLQFLVAQAEPSTSGGSNGFEGDNDPNGSANTPLSQPTIYNATLCGKNRALGKEHYGLLLRRGTHATVRNSIFMGFSAGLDVRDGGTSPDIAHSLFFRNLDHNLAYPELVVAKGHRIDKELVDDDGGVDEQALLLAPVRKNSESDPLLGDCFDPHAPDFKPEVVLRDGAAWPPDDGFFDATARYLGAFRNQDDGWDRGGWLNWGE